MSEQQANEPESLTKTKSEGFEAIGADANLEADDWDTKKIGYLAARILSGVRARKEAGEGNAVPSPAVIARASLGGREDVASNRKRSGGAVPAVQGSKEARDPSRRQQPPDAQTKRREPKYRSVTYSGG